MSIVEELRSSFINEGIDINEPASASDILDFEARHGVKLPPSLADYFLNFNGTGEQNFGSTGLAFFSLAEFKPVIEVMTQSESDREAYPNCFVFADFLCWCWGYAVQLNSAGSDGAVFQVSGTEPPPRKVANSFSEFIGNYLKDSYAAL